MYAVRIALELTETALRLRLEFERSTDRMSHENIHA